MQVCRISAEFPLVLAGDREIVVWLGTRGYVDVAITLGFFDALARPNAGIDVIGDTVFWQQIQRNLSKLLAGATLQE